MRTFNVENNAADSEIKYYWMHKEQQIETRRLAALLRHIRAVCDIAADDDLTTLRKHLNVIRSIALRADDPQQKVTPDGD